MSNCRVAGDTLGTLETDSKGPQFTPGRLTSNNHFPAFRFNYMGYTLADDSSSQTARLLGLHSFALAMAGFLLLLFWVEASDRVGWADAALASVAAVLIVLVIILVRRGEKARWIAQPQPTWYLYPLTMLGALALLFGAVYADTYLLHRRDTTSNWLRNNSEIAIATTVVLVCSTIIRRHRSKRQL